MKRAGDDSKHPEVPFEDAEKLLGRRADRARPEQTRAEAVPSRPARAHQVKGTATRRGGGSRAAAFRGPTPPASLCDRRGSLTRARSSENPHYCSSLRKPGPPRRPGALPRQGKGRRERRGSAQLDHYPWKPGYRLAAALNITTVLERRSPGCVTVSLSQRACAAAGQGSCSSPSTGAPFARGRPSPFWATSPECRAPVRQAATYSASAGQLSQRERGEGARHASRRSEPRGLLESEVPTLSVLFP